MPELPEVEVIRRDLEKEIVGRRIKDAEIRPGTNAMKVVPRHGRRKEFSDLLVGAKIERIDRRGRRLFLDLDTDDALVIALGSAGRLVKTSTSEEIAPHTHVVIEFTIGGQLRYVDSKLTGEVFVMPRSELDKDKDAGRLGSSIDPLDNGQPITWHQFSSLLEEGKTGLKKLLTDEAFVVGLGNMYSDEILFSAGIRYDRQSDKLSSQDVRRLYRALMETLQEAVKARGTSWGDDGFTDLSGTPGEYQLELKVYERDGEPCRRCRSEIVKEKFDGGFTYFCPQCQP
ncbi:MAG: bifunctional DNA-formamidopyrimidine glycosylase/DNA-(apurinic or apyrimidinic site) lyase [Actinomycetota bacterium]